MTEYYESDTTVFLTTSKAGVANLPSTLRPPFNSRQVWGIYLHLKRHAVALGSRTVHPAHSSSEISDRTLMTENLSKGRADARARFLPMVKSQGFPLARKCDVTGGDDSEVWNRRRCAFPVFVVDRRAGAPSASLTTTERRFSRALLHQTLTTESGLFD